MALAVEDLPLRDNVKSHLSTQAGKIYDSVFNLIWIHTTGEKEERELTAHQVAWDRLKQEYKKPRHLREAPKVQAEAVDVIKE